MSPCLFIKTYLTSKKACDKVLFLYELDVHLEVCLNTIDITSVIFLYITELDLLLLVLIYYNFILDYLIKRVIWAGMFWSLLSRFSFPLSKHLLFFFRKFLRLEFGRLSNFKLFSLTVLDFTHLMIKTQPRNLYTNIVQLYLSFAVLFWISCFMVHAMLERWSFLIRQFDFPRY